MEKIMITEDIKFVNGIYLDEPHENQTVESYCSLLMEFKNKAIKRGFLNVRLRTESDYSGGPWLVLIGDRLENDDEYKARIKEEAKELDKKIKKDAETRKKELLQLKLLQNKYRNELKAIND